MSIYIKNALVAEGKRASVQIEENKITSINPKRARKDDIVIDARDKALVPAFYNMHTHAAMILFKGYAEDMTLHEWLEKKIFPIEAKLKPKDVYYGTLLACAEMIHSGTVCFNDMYFFENETAKAAKKAGMRAVIGKAFGSLAYNRQAVIKAVKSLRRQKLVMPAIAPHAIYTTTKEIYEEAAELAEELDCFLHTHASETQQEVKFCLEKYRKRPVELFEEIGVLSRRAILAHCVWLNKREIRLISKSKACVASCPTSNLKLASGIAPLKELVEAKARVTLATDGSASNNSLSMFEAVKLASILQKNIHRDARVMPARLVFEMATKEAASFLGLKAGKLEEGFLADLCLLDLKSISMSPCHSITANVIYSCTYDAVDTVICDGKIIMENKHISWEEHARKKAEKRIEKLFYS